LEEKIEGSGNRNIAQDQEEGACNLIGKYLGRIVYSLYWVKKPWVRAASMVMR
jgi:hypothetical protein